MVDRVSNRLPVGDSYTGGTHPVSFFQKGIALLRCAEKQAKFGESKGSPESAKSEEERLRQSAACFEDAALLFEAAAQQCADSQNERHARSLAAYARMSASKAARIVEENQRKHRSEHKTVNASSDGLSGSGYGPAGSSANADSKVSNSQRSKPRNVLVDNVNQRESDLGRAGTRLQSTLRDAFASFDEKGCPLWLSFVKQAESLMQRFNSIVDANDGLYSGPGGGYLAPNQLGNSSALASTPSDASVIFVRTASGSSQLGSPPVAVTVSSSGTGGVQSPVPARPSSVGDSQANLSWRMHADVVEKESPRPIAPLKKYESAAGSQHAVESNRTNEIEILRAQVRDRENECQRLKAQLADRTATIGQLSQWRQDMLLEMSKFVDAMMKWDRAESLAGAKWGMQSALQANSMSMHMKASIALQQSQHQQHFATANLSSPVRGASVGSAVSRPSDGLSSTAKESQLMRDLQSMRKKYEHQKSKYSDLKEKWDRLHKIAASKKKQQVDQTQSHD